MKFRRMGRPAEFRGGPIIPQFSGREGFREGPKPDYHSAALCKQVLRIVSGVLSGECGDALLQALVVERVVPAPNAGRLMIMVIARGDGAPAELLVRLEAVKRMLRARIAEGIVRKRVPELTFLVLPAGVSQDREEEL